MFCLGNFWELSTFQEEATLFGSLMKSSNGLVNFLLLKFNHFWCIKWIFRNFFQHLKIPIRITIGYWPIRSQHPYLLLYIIKKRIDIGRNWIINDWYSHVFQNKAALLSVTIWYQCNTHVTWFQIDPLVSEHCSVQGSITRIWCWNKWCLIGLLIWFNNDMAFKFWVLICWRINDQEPSLVCPVIVSNILGKFLRTTKDSFGLYCSIFLICFH